MTPHFKLRDYQEENLGKLRELYDNGQHRLLNVLATGLGKTVIFSHLPQVFPEIYKYGMLVLVHRDELVTQAVDKIKKSNPTFRVGVEKADVRADPQCNCVVASVQSVGRKGSSRLGKFRNRIFAIVTDEAHHAPAPTYRYVLNYFGVGDENKDGCVGDGIRRISLGYTATPNRSDGKGLIKVYDEIGANLDLRWAILDGWLVDVKAQRVTTQIDISRVKTVRGDFAQSELDEAINNDVRNEKIVSGYMQHAPDSYAIAFCASVSHAHSLAIKFNLAGIPAVSIDGETDKDYRRDAVEDFKAGNIKVLTNFGVFTEGFDAPRCNTILMCRPTKSESLYAQMIGRGTRPIVDVNFETAGERLKAISESDKPHLNILDFVDVCGNHKLVTVTKLAGLKENFETNGKKLFKEVVEVIEGLERENPDRPFREADSFDEVETMAEEIDIWQNDVQRFIKNSDDLRSLSRFRWWRLGPDSVSIDIPEKRKVTIRVDRDPMGRYTFTKILQPHRDQDGIFIPKQVIVSPKKVDSLEEAMAAIDKVIVQKHEGVAHLCEHSPRWGRKPASDKQRKFLSDLGITIPDHLKLSKADASILIDAALKKKKQDAKAKRAAGANRQS